MEFKSELFYLLRWRWFTTRVVCLGLLSCWRVKRRPWPSFAADCSRFPKFHDSFHFDDIHSSRRSEASLQLSTLVIVCDCGDFVLSPNVSSVSMASFVSSDQRTCFLQVVLRVSQSVCTVSIGLLPVQGPTNCLLWNYNCNCATGFTCVLAVVLGSLDASLTSPLLPTSVRLVLALFEFLDDTSTPVLDSWKCSSNFPYPPPELWTPTYLFLKLNWFLLFLAWSFLKLQLKLLLDVNWKITLRQILPAISFTKPLHTHGLCHGSIKWLVFRSHF